MSEIKDEYRTIASGAGWVERRDLGHLRFSGRDVLSFLQALVTNDVASLVPGAGAWAAYLTPQGRMVADLALYCRPAGVTASVPADQAASLATRFEQLVFSEDVQVSDESAATAELLVIGSAAAEKLGSGLGVDATRLSAAAELSHLEWEGGFVARAGESLLPSYSIVVPSARYADVLARLTAAAMPQMSEALVESLRVEAGRPKYGVDMHEDTIPLEAGLLERAISTTKGCYVGQEIIVRILHRGGGRVARRLVTLGITADDTPAPGTSIEYEGRVVGALTSVARDPATNGILTLGYVQREFAELGKAFELAGHPGTRAVVTGFAR